MANKIPPYLLHNEEISLSLIKSGKSKLSFVDRTILSSARTLKTIYVQAENAGRNNLIQKIHPHIKFLSLIYLAVVISIVQNLNAQVLISAFIFLLYVFAGIRIFQVYKRILFIVFLFGFLVIIPASLNIITPGEIIFELLSFSKASHFWIYTIPHTIGITKNGLHVVSLVCLRLLNTVSFSMLIVYTTSFPAFIKSFKIIGVPDTFLMIISLSYKYIFILSRTIEEVYFAIKSKLFGSINSENIRTLVSGRVFYIFRRSMIIYENTYFAMVSRAYTGTIILHSAKRLRYMDFLILLIVIIFGITAILL
jgi:cobalt ECF transporter T component CbiQ